jgi:hypothetical protein
MNEHAKQKDTSNPPRRTHPAVRSAIRLSEARPSYHMMSSPDLETGLARLIRYNGIVSGASTISFEPAKGGKWTRVELFGNGSPIPRQRYDYMALIQLTSAAGCSVVPSNASLSPSCTRSRSRLPLMTRPSARLACLRGGSGDDRFLLSAKAQFRGRMRAAAFLNMRRVVFRLQLLRAGRETQTVEILLWLRRSSWITQAIPVIILTRKI